MVMKDTAAIAWVLVQQLQVSDESVEIKDPSGRVINCQELRARAMKEAN
jgi:hypothetical protein